MKRLRLTNGAATWSSDEQCLIADGLLERIAARLRDINVNPSPLLNDGDFAVQLLGDLPRRIVSGQCSTTSVESELDSKVQMAVLYSTLLSLAGGNRNAALEAIAAAIKRAHRPDGIFEVDLGFMKVFAPGIRLAPT